MIFGTKTYELSLVKDYVSHWGVKEAIRELIQNALDSDSPFVYSFQWEGESCMLTLNSEYATLTPQTLLLGATSKSENSNAIGSFGEGYKIALLVLTRMGYDVEILNGDVLWKPRFKFNSKFGEELLVIEETDIKGNTNKGLTFKIYGITEEDEQDIINSCLRMQDSIGPIRQTSYGDILTERPGKLYVGGLFICDTDLDFGYNVKPAHITLERDRQTVSNWDLLSITKNMWFETKEFDLIAQMVEDEVEDISYVEYGSPELVKEACYKLFREKNPDTVIARNNQEREELVKRGLTVYVGGGAYYSQVSSSSSYKNEKHIHMIVKNPQQILTEWLSENRSEMRTKSIVAFKQLIEDSKTWKGK